MEYYEATFIYTDFFMFYMLMTCSTFSPHSGMRVCVCVCVYVFKYLRFM